MAPISRVPVDAEALVVVRHEWLLEAVHWLSMVSQGREISDLHALTFSVNINGGRLKCSGRYADLDELGIHQDELLDDPCLLYTSDAADE